jgi:hypothetical protein
MMSKRLMAEERKALQAFALGISVSEFVRKMRDKLEIGDLALTTETSLWCLCLNGIVTITRDDIR